MVGCFRDVALWVALVGSRVMSLQEFGKVRYEVGCWVLGVVLVVKPIVSFCRDVCG